MAVSHPVPHHEIEDLLGAYVLDACEPDEVAAVEAHLLTCDACVAEATEFRTVVELLGTVEAEPPPVPVAAALLAAATRPRRPAPAPPPPGAGRRGIPGSDGPARDPGRGAERRRVGSARLARGLDVRRS